jgi:spermidine synthase
VDFFHETKRALKDDGLLALSLPQSAGYIGKRMQMASGSVFNALKQVFRHVGVSAQEYGGIFASDAQIITDPDILADRFIRREIHTRYFHEHVFYDAFATLNVDYVMQRLSTTDTVNTDIRPLAYLYTLMLWSEIHGGALLSSLLGIRGWTLIIIAGAILTCISLLISRKKKPVVFFSVVTTGFSGMSFVIAVFLAYQSLYGYVYEMIGLLSALFMAGLWLGTIVTEHAKTPLKTLFWLEVLTILLAFTAPHFFRTDLFFYVLILLAGTITGGQFNSANLSLNDKEAGGKLYAMDLTGSFIGALIPSLIIIPLFGAQYAFFSILFIKTFSAALVYFLEP